MTEAYQRNLLRKNANYVRERCRGSTACRTDGGLAYPGDRGEKVSRVSWAVGKASRRMIAQHRGREEGRSIYPVGGSE